MQDRPNAGELLEAIEEFLRERSAKDPDRFLRFQFLVAANSLAILRREWDGEEAFAHTEWHGLDGLLGVEPPPSTFKDLRQGLEARNERLCDRIADGAFDEPADEVALLAHLVETVSNKVRIATPNALA